MAGYILIIAIIILLCISLNKLSSRLGIPMLLAFILLGMLLGSDGVFKIPFNNYGIAEQLCTIALIFIMFYGGFGTSWNQAKPVAVKSILLSSLGVILTAVVTGLFCFFILRYDFLESMLIGSVISSTDAASVFSILRSKHLNLKDHTASMLEVESGSNDPCSYMLTIILLSMMSGEFSGGQLAYMVFAQVVYGGAIGVIIGLGSVYALAKIKFVTDGFDTIFVFAVALIAYALATWIGGNGYLSVYIAGIILGNNPIHNKKSLVNFFDGLTGLMQMLIFCLLGLLSSPSELIKIALPALAIALFITFVSRPIAIFSILAPFKCSFNQKLLVSWCGLRGAASIVFAIMATVSPAYMKHDIFHIVFLIVLFSMGIQGSLITRFAEKLDMIDDQHNVMKTFSDYSDEMPIQFIKLSIASGHPWSNKEIKDIRLVPGVLLVLILRGEERIIPKGNTTILAGDSIILSALTLEEDFGVHLSEVRIEKEHEWIGKPLADIKLGDKKLVMLVKRNEEVIIPNGQTTLQENDILIESGV